ncbi:MAG TPA: hypothetical protein VIO14_14195 [Dehalococcoidia bacterium]
MSDERRAVDATDAYIDAVLRGAAPADDPVVRLLAARPALPPRLAAFRPEAAAPAPRRRRAVLPALAAALLVLAVLALFPPARAAAAEAVRAVFGAAGYVRTVLSDGGDPQEAADRVLQQALAAASPPGKVFYVQATQVNLSADPGGIQEQRRFWFFPDRSSARGEIYEDGVLRTVTVVEGGQAATYVPASGYLEDLSPAPLPLWYLQAIAQYPEARVQGHRSLDGRQVIQLRGWSRITGDGGDYPAGTTFAQDLYLDARSFLPVRLEVSLRPPPGTPAEERDTRARPTGPEHEDEILLQRYDFEPAVFLDPASLPPDHFSIPGLEGQLDEHLRQLEGFDAFPLFWPGPSFAGHQFSSASHTAYDAPPGAPPNNAWNAVTFLYGTCTGRPCAMPVSLHVRPACHVRPEQAAAVGPLETVRGGALARQGPGKLLVWTGGTFVDVNLPPGPDQPGDAALLDQALQALQGYGRNAIGPGEPLPPPDFGGCPEAAAPAPPSAR